MDYDFIFEVGFSIEVNIQFVYELIYLVSIIATLFICETIYFRFKLIYLIFYLLFLNGLHNSITKMWRYIIGCV